MKIKGIRKICEDIVQKLNEELHNDIEVGNISRHDTPCFILHIFSVNTLLRFLLFIDSDGSYVLSEKHYGIKITFMPNGIEEPVEYFVKRLSNLVEALIAQAEDDYFLPDLANEVMEALKERLSSLKELPVNDDVYVSQTHLPLNQYFTALTFKDTSDFLTLRLGFELKFSLSERGLSLVCDCYPVNSYLKVPSELTTAKYFTLDRSYLVSDLVNDIIHCLGREVHYTRILSLNNRG